jgi:hypothetical protein
MSGRSVELSPAAQALLQRRSARARQARPEPTIPRLGSDVPPPLSFAQWRLWFLEQLRPGTNAWNTPVITRIRGPLELTTLQRALQLLVDRHATLRTVFPAPRSRPAPVPIDDPHIALPVTECPTPAGTAHTATATWIAAEVRRPFALERDLMLRASVLRLAEDDHVVAVVAHHIACDGWSKGLLVHELGIAYDSLRAGREPELADLPVQYTDFAAWQRAWLRDERVEQLTGYWRGRLAGHAPAAELPLDFPRPRVQQFEGAVQWLSVPGDLARAVVALGRGRRATPFMTFVAAFKALLYAYSAQQDILLGSPSAMRTLPELEHMVGLFANTLVYRTNLAGRPSFDELVGRVRETALGVYQHQDLPFERIVEAVAPPRDPSRNPLVQVNMRVEGREPELRLDGLSCETLTVDPGIARFDLAIELGASDDGYDGYLEYNVHLFTPATAHRLAEHYVELLRAVVAAPDAPLDELELVRKIRRER